MRHPFLPYEVSASGYVTDVAGDRLLDTSQRHSFRGLQRPALQGYAALWREPHIFKGAVDIFEPHCFSPLPRDVKFLVGHNQRVELGSTAAGTLELYSDDRGLAFRLMLDDSKEAKAAALEVEVGQRLGMSVGERVVTARKQVIGGHSCRIIERSELCEISLVTKGALNEAFVQLVDGSREPPLAKAALSLMLDRALNSLERMRRLAT